MISLTLIVLTQVAELEVSSTAERVAASRERFVDGPRLRFGIGTWSAGGRYPDYAGGVAGLSTHFGVQLNDRVAFYVLAQATTALLFNAIVAGSMAEYSGQPAFFRCPWRSMTSMSRVRPRLSALFTVPSGSCSRRAISG